MEDHFSVEVRGPFSCHARSPLTPGLPSEAHFLALVPPEILHGTPATLLLSSNVALSLTGASSGTRITTSSLSSVALRPLDANNLREVSTASLVGEQSGQFLLGKPGILAIIPSARHSALATRWSVELSELVQHGVLPYIPEETILWDPAISATHYIKQSSPRITLSQTTAGAVFAVYASHNLNGSRIFLPATVTVTTNRAKTLLPTPPPSPRPGQQRAPSVEPPSAEDTSPASTSRALIVRPSSTGMLAIFRHLLAVLFSLIASFLRVKSPKRDDEPSERTPLLSGTISSDSHTSAESQPPQERPSITARVPQDPLIVLVVPQGSGKGITSEVNGKSWSANESSSVDIAGLGSADVLRYESVAPDVVKFSH